MVPDAFQQDVQNELAYWALLQAKMEEKGCEYGQRNYSVECSKRASLLRFASS